MSIEINLPDPGMYNGRVMPGRPIRISNGKRTFEIELNKPINIPGGFNLSVFLLDDGRWVIKTRLPEINGITKVFEIVEARLMVYPVYGDKLVLLGHDDQ